MIIKETTIDGILIKNVIIDESDMSSTEQKLKWESICNTCQYKKEDMCMACNCLLVNIMLYSSSTCPINNW
jgi:hypothetical protein